MRVTTVRTNHFPLITLPGQNIFRYDVMFVPECSSSRARQILRIWQDEAVSIGLLKEICPVYDGRLSLFTQKEFEFALPCVFHIEVFAESCVS